MRITSEPYSNTILVTSNSKENLAVVEDVLRQLDSPSEAGESTLHVPLMFAKAAVVARQHQYPVCQKRLAAVAPDRATTATENNNSLGQQQGQQTSDSSQSAFALAQDIKEEGYYPWIGGQPDNTRSWRPQLAAPGQRSGRPRPRGGR